MPRFAYKIRTPEGATASGVLDAGDASAASATLRGGGSLVLSLEPASEPSKARRGGVSVGRLPFVKPRALTVEVALRQLSVMLSSGLTLLEALRSTAEQSSDLMGSALEDLAERVQEGQTLTQALSRHPWIGRMVRQLVEVGEQTGTLDVVLLRAAESLEKRRLLMGQAIAALMYPGVVFLAAIGVTGFMLIFAVPRLTSYLTTMGQELPPATQLLVDASDFLLTTWPLLGGLALLAAISFGLAYSSPAGRLLIDGLFLRVPVIGFIMRTSATAMFSRSFALLLASGVTIIEALRTCQDLHRNRRLSVLIADARENVIAGDLLAPGLAARKTFTPMLASMVAIGERSGNLDQTLPACAEFHEQRLASLVQMLSSVVEIAVSLIVGGIVGYVYIAFMMALYGASL